jgi:hypothetical protein
LIFDLYLWAKRKNLLIFIFICGEMKHNQSGKKRRKAEKLF